MQVLDNGDLLISAVRESDAGLYSCTRANEAGEVRGSAYLGVLGKCLPCFFCLCYGIAFYCISLLKCYFFQTKKTASFVTVKTQIIQPPVDTKVLLGLTATLQCKVSSDPMVPYHLEWFHDKQ